MASKVSQRTVYVVTAVIVASMIGGFAVAQLGLGGTNTSYQGSQTTSVTALPGLTWVSTDIAVVPTSLTYTTPCLTVGTACDVTAAPATLCVGSFNASHCNVSDFVEQVTLTTVALTTFTASVHYPVVVLLTVSVTATPVGGTQGTYSGQAFYLQQTGSPSVENVVLDFDIGATPTGPGAVTSVSVVITTP